MYNETNYPDWVIKKFYNKIIFPENYEESDDCWIWNGSFSGKNVRKNPYGGFSFNINGQRYYYIAHRFCYEYYHGPILNNLHVLHNCDNTACVNINHLWLGTNQDNVDDKVEKKRQAHGETHGNVLLTNEIIFQIYNYCINNQNKNTSQVAELFQLTEDHFKRIINGLSWKHLYQTLSKSHQLRLKNILNIECSRVLNEEIVKQIKYKDLKNMRISDIARKYNVSVQTIYHIRSEKTWSHV